jgi:surfactin synthase thioesterase subunit
MSGAPGVLPHRAIVRGATDAAPALRLFCFPYAGGGTTAFAGWQRRLGPDVEVCALRPPGRETRIGEPAARRLEPLLAGLLDVVRPLLDRPFVLFGHSLGAIVAFEMARALRREGGPLPRRLCVSGCAHPSRAARSALHALDTLALVAELRRFGGPLPRDPRFLDVFLPTIRADLEVYETHRPRVEPPLAIPISAFGGSADPVVPSGGIEAWRRETSAGFDVTALSGGHLFLLESRRDLLDAIAQRLAPGAFGAGARSREVRGAHGSAA